MTILVNLYGGPGAGKSTLATRVYSALKMSNVNAEYVPEFAKEITWQERFHILQNQMLVTGTQIQRILDLKDKVDVIVTDSPMEMGRFYMDREIMARAVTAEAQIASIGFSELNYFVRRDDTYLEKGRTQSRSEATEIDDNILAYLRSFQRPYTDVQKTEAHAERIVTDVLSIRQRNTDAQEPQADSEPVSS